MLLRRCGAAYCPHGTVTVHEFWGRGNWNKVELQKILPDCKWLDVRDRFAFNTMYIFCWSNLGCYYSSLFSSRWQEHQIYSGELLNTSFSNFFSIFSNISYFIFHSYFKDICAVFIYKGLTLFLLSWGWQNEKRHL